MAVSPLRDSMKFENNGACASILTHVLKLINVQLDV